VGEEGWGGVAMISGGVEITIAGGVVAMVCVLSLGRCFYFYFYFYFLYHVFIVTVQELACSASYGVNKTSISNNQKTNENIKSSPNRVKYSTHRHLTAKNERIIVKNHNNSLLISGNNNKQC